MKYFFILFFTAFLATACSSDQPEEMSRNSAANPDYPNLVQVTPPENVKATPSKVYVDSVKVINAEDGKALLISGNFANSCTSLKKVTHSVHGDTLTISPVGWMPADKLCATVLTPFSFIFDKLPSGSLADLNYVFVNDEQFEID